MNQNTAITVYQPSDLARYSFLDPQRNVAQGLKAAVGNKLAVTDLVKITIDNNGKLHIPALGGEQIVDFVEGVVVINHPWRGFYNKKYNKKEAGAVPQCTSNDGIRGVGDPGTWCEQCPFNQWGSAGTYFGDGGRGKACKEFWFMYLWRAGKKRPELLQVPSTSMGMIRQYMMNLLDIEELEKLVITVQGEEVPMPILGVVTRFTPQEIKGQWKIIPTVAGILPEVVWSHSLDASMLLTSMLATSTRSNKAPQPTTPPINGATMAQPSRAARAAAVMEEEPSTEPPIDTEEWQGLPQPGTTKARRSVPTRVPPPAPVFNAEEMAGDGLSDIDL